MLLPQGKDMPPNPVAVSCEFVAWYSIFGSTYVMDGDPHDCCSQGLFIPDVVKVFEVVLNGAVLNEVLLNEIALNKTGFDKLLLKRLCAHTKDELKHKIQTVSMVIPYLFIVDISCVKYQPINNQ